MTTPTSDQAANAAESVNTFSHHTGHAPQAGTTHAVSHNNGHASQHEDSTAGHGSAAEPHLEDTDVSASSEAIPENETAAESSGKKPRIPRGQRILKFAGQTLLRNFKYEDRPLAEKVYAPYNVFYGDATNPLYVFFNATRQGWVGEEDMQAIAERVVTERHLDNDVAQLWLDELSCFFTGSYRKYGWEGEFDVEQDTGKILVHIKPTSEWDGMHLPEGGRVRKR